MAQQKPGKNLQKNMSGPLRTRPKPAKRAPAPLPHIAPNKIDPLPADLGLEARESIRLSFLMHDVSRMRRSAYDQYMKPLGVTRAQWWVLAHLTRHDGMMQTQLADVLEVGKASLGDVIETLEAGGWVTRHPDPSDRRAKRVYLAKPAQGLIQRMTALEVAFNARIFGDLDADERQAMHDSLVKVKRAIAGLGDDPITT